MITPQNSQSPFKRRYSSSSASSRSSTRSRKRTRLSTRKFRFRKRSNKRITFTRRLRALRNRRRTLLARNGGRTINVKNDTELFNRIKRTQNVTNQQQNIINKRFKEGYSPFQRIIEDQIQLTKTNKPNNCKLIWRCGGTLDFVRYLFDKFPTDLITPDSSITRNTDYYIKGQDNSVYIGGIHLKYDIYNPTNYDQELIIYDIVYKDDSRYPVNNSYFEDGNDISVDNNDPISLMKLGVSDLKGHIFSNVASTTDVIVGQPAAIEFFDPSFKPTMSYPFNLYCNIVKKQVFRLQPGATMTHYFKWNPKALINRGYLYKYKDFFTDANNTVNIALKNITCGSLFRIKGQLASDGSDTDKSHVVSLSPKISIKEELTYKYYYMKSKYTFISKDRSLLWTPEDLDKMEIVNDEQIKPAKETNTNPSDNV